MKENNIIPLSKIMEKKKAKQQDSITLIKKEFLSLSKKHIEQIKIELFLSNKYISLDKTPIDICLKSAEETLTELIFQSQNSVILSEQNYVQYASYITAEITDIALTTLDNPYPKITFEVIYSYIRNMHHSLFPFNKELQTNKEQSINAPK